MPEFQGRQVVTLHNQRDFLFFRRHRYALSILQAFLSYSFSCTRYAFRSPEKVELQEIGPRFTLKLRWLKKGIPAVHSIGEGPSPSEPGVDSAEESTKDNEVEDVQDAKLSKVVPPTHDELLWAWKVRLSHFL
jgi:ribosome production factor 1